MKIYFRNKTAKLKLHNLIAACKNCLFYRGIPCPLGTSTIVDCDGKGRWIDGESSSIFKI